MARRSKGLTSSNRILTIVAVGITTLLLASSLLILIPFGSGGDDTDVADDDVVRVTPGAEVARLETRIASDPDDIDAVMVLAEVLANSGRITESIPWFEQAIQVRPDDVNLRIAFGRALQRAGSSFDAELQFKKAVDLDPDDPAPAYYLALFYETREPPRVDDAREWFQRAIDADPESLIGRQASDRLAALDADPTPSVTP